ncbi:MAG: hypothetical protein FWF88_01810 [Peptococcaceae bacterium]|nr:hypothetical protein [Peptococcaceae bacterium]
MDFTEIEEIYTQLHARVGEQEGLDIEVDFIEDYIRLFTQISEGKMVDANRYAQLLRKITQGTIEFEDEEVFRVAEDLVKGFEKLENDPYGSGIRQIKIVYDGSGESSLVIDYADIGGDRVCAYAVRKMDKDEKVHYGERLIEDDGLGENRVAITFYGAESSQELFRMYSFGIVHKLKTIPGNLESNFCIRFATPPGHDGFVAYIGSNEPINIDEQGYTSINEENGSIIIALN